MLREIGNPTVDIGERRRTFEQRAESIEGVKMLMASERVLQIKVNKGKCYRREHLVEKNTRREFMAKWNNRDKKWNQFLL